MVGCGGRDLCLGRDVRQHAGAAGGFLGAGDPRGEIRARMGRAVGMGTDCGAAGYPPSEASSEGGAMRGESAPYRHEAACRDDNENKGQDRGIEWPVATADGRGERFDGGIAFGRNRACGAMDNLLPSCAGEDTPAPGMQPLLLRNDFLSEDSQGVDVRSGRNASPMNCSGAA